jgi:MYXO-CTERM domain-containing protein
MTSLPLLAIVCAVLMYPRNGRACTTCVCGNGIVEAGEECDDGDGDDRDACTIRCTTPKCGDGVLEGREECDDGNFVIDDGCNNICWLDSDRDTIRDIHELGDLDPSTPPVDTDGCRVEPGIDPHAEGRWPLHVPDYLDIDSDNDGLYDFWEAGDSDPETPPIDSDGDGAPDFRQSDFLTKHCRVELATIEPQAGCGCAASNAAAPGAWLVLVLLALRRRAIHR